MSVTNIFKRKEVDKLTYGRPVSGIYQDYVEPIMLEWVKMKPRPGYDELNKMLISPWTIWNSVVMQDFYPEADDMNLMGWMLSLTKRNQDRAFVDWWIHRKRQDFGQYRYLFGDCIFYENKDGESRCRAEIKLPKSVTKKYGQYGEKSPHIDKCSSLQP